MDRLSQLRGEAGGSRDSTLDTTSPPSEAFMTANESSSKYYSLSEVDSTFDISSIKDVSLASTATESEGTITNTDELISNLSPIGKKSDILDSFKIDTQIEAANILSGGVAIFDDNDNSYDGHELVIDDNVEVDEKSNSEVKQSESLEFKPDENTIETSLIPEEAHIASKDTEVVLQIDGKQVDAIDIGNGLYLYRRAGQEELAAVQISDDDQQQPSFKFLKVRENAEGNLEVYEEIEIEIPKEVPAKEGKVADKNISSHVPIMDINKVISDTACNKVAERKVIAPRKEQTITITETIDETENKESLQDSKSEVNLNGKMMKFSESRKSPVIGSFTPMTYHSTPNKEGKPLTKTMVDQKLHTNRHSDLSNVKKTIEVHTDSCKPKTIETPTKIKDAEENKLNEIANTDKDIVTVKLDEKSMEIEEQNTENDIKEINDAIVEPVKIEANKSDEKSVDEKEGKGKEKCLEHNTIDLPENVKQQPEESIQLIESKENKAIENITIVEEHKEAEKIEVEKVEENKILDEKCNQIIEANNEEVIQVDSEPDEGINANEPMEIDDEITLTIAEPVPSIEESKEVAKDNNEIEGKDSNPAEIVVNKQEQSLVVIDEPILIEDDEVSIIEEVIVESKEEKVESKSEKVESNNEKVESNNEKVESNNEKVESCGVNEVINDDKFETQGIAAHDKKSSGKMDDINKKEETIDDDNKNDGKLDDNNKNDAKLTDNNKDDVQLPEKDLKHSEDTKKEDDKIIQENTDKNLVRAKSLSIDPVIPHESIKDLSSQVTKEVKKDIINISSETEKESIKDSTTTLLPSPNEPAKDSISAPIEENMKKDIDTKDLQPKYKEVSEKAPVNDQKRTVQPSKICVDTQPSGSTEIKNTVPTDTIKHDIPTNISSLLAIKHQSLVPPKTIQGKTKAEEKFEVEKPSSSVRNVEKISVHKTEAKVLQISSKQDSVNTIQLTKTMPLVAQKRVDSNRVPIAVPQNIVHEKNANKADMLKKFLPQIVKNATSDKHQLPSISSKRPVTSHRDEKKDLKLPSKDISNEKGKGVINMEITKVPKLDPVKTNILKPDVSSSSSKITIQNVKNKNESKDKRELPRAVEPKPINNNHAAVPFGKWTEANRQEFLNKFKIKTSVTTTNSNQLKNSNDLNRRDVLKKIDSQRQSSNALSKTQEANKLNLKPETAAFSNKPTIVNKEISQDAKVPQKSETVEIKAKPVAPKNISKQDVVSKTPNEPSQAATGTSASKKEVCQRTGVVQNLIDKTIEGMIHRNAPVPKTQDESKQQTNKEPSVTKPTKPEETYPVEQATLDAIEMKMNELHGIPFIERPPHELPKVHTAEPKNYSKVEKEKPAAPKTKIPNLLPFPNKNQQKVIKETVIEVDSEDEIIEHEPITGDIDLNKKNQIVKPPAKEKLPTNITQQIQQEKLPSEATKKDAIITEKDFDKFARRNSITYENCLTVNFDGKEPHNVVQTVVEKDTCPKNYSRNDASRIDSKVKMPYKYQNVRSNTQPAKVHPVKKFTPANDDASNRNQSKLQKAYHSALTAKRQMAADSPITIIEDKPVKVVFIDNVDYAPSLLNVQGQDLSPAKRPIPESDVTVSTCDSLDSDMLESTDDAKSQDEAKIKTKHQRKQVLTPVDEPELELIEPSDLGIEVSPKKKRKMEDDKTDKNLKYPRKKFYMLSSTAVTEEKVINPVEVTKNPLKETVNLNDNGVAHKNPVSALDSLVKAAELIETQTENINTSIMSNPDDPATTPVKRGRGRPRKYPLTPEGTVDKNKVVTPSPQKKPRLIDAKLPKRDTVTDDSDSEGEIIKENWTMGKINENIVCPICNKLFRTENVVFKHVKHCTGPSPSRSDSDKRSPRRMRISQDFDTKSIESKSDDMDMDDDKPLVIRKETPKKRKSKDSVTKSDEKDEVIVIEDTPIKEKPAKVDERKHHESRKPRAKIPQKNNDLVCEFCGKTFRQLSYLVSHKLQHKKQEKVEPKKTEKDVSVPIKSVYSCEVCKKEFRKLHHLVQHRIIHNPTSVPPRSSRKSSSEQSESKIEKEPSTSKQSDDPSAGFRCEPCDKSFRKLHHLVEHRETHDGINRQKTTTAPPTKEEKTVEKPVVLHQCDICKKSFKKLQHLNEHKEQHVETSSEKSDDKSVKSSLSTRDIIHECSLCYMVFPNEHSLNKHTIICQRKKRQSKQLKPTDETEGGDEPTESPPPEEKIESKDLPKPKLETTKKDEKNREDIDKIELVKDKTALKELEVPREKSEEPVKVLEKEIGTQKLETKISDQQVPPAKREFIETETATKEAMPEVPEKIKKVEVKEPIKIHETPKKKTPLKDKTAKRLKTVAAPAPAAEEIKPTTESSDDDDVRYMLNPNFKPEDVSEEKVFMKVRAKKRSSLQIERPNSKELVKRRTSLQHPPKIPRLKPKVTETIPATVKKEIKTPKLEPVPSTDSDDSETTKYSFPATIPEKPIKLSQDRTPKDSDRKSQKKSLIDKRKSLSAIAKRKSLGKVVTARHKASPLKQVKKRMLDAEHRCDCGQLFSSAALLSRHTTLAHTPPRIRRRRSPPPEEKPTIKPAPRKSSAAEKPKQSPASRKSSARSDSSTSTNTKSAKSEVKSSRKSQVKETESPSDSRKAKTEKSEAKSSVKPRRSGAHRGVPVPDKMRKLMQKK